MPLQEALSKPLFKIDESGEKCILTSNFAERFSQELMDTLDVMELDKSKRGDVKLVLSLAPLMMSMFDKRRNGSFADNPLSAEEKEAYLTYLKWSYEKNEGENIQSGTHIPITRASSDLRELFRAGTGLNEPTTTYTMPIVRYSYNSTESNWQLSYNL